MQEDDYILIEKYLEGTLEEGEKGLFQRRVGEDIEFAKAFTLRKSMDIFLEKEQNSHNLAEKLDRLGKEFFPTEEKVRVVPLWRRPLVMGMLAAAAIALLLMVWNPFKPATLYKQYAVHQPLSLIEKSTDFDGAAVAQTAFNEGNYEAAYQALTQYILEYPQNNKALLHLGISALEIGKTTEAIAIFSALQNGGSVYKDYGTWYLALTYLKTKDFEKAEQQLEEIPVSEKLLYGKAELLLKELGD
ncbi:tetratricopeptide repeat protein [bacterium]|nr:tetratricopeptide repeat protein [bacterium]